MTLESSQAVSGGGITSSSVPGVGVRHLGVDAFIADIGGGGMTPLCFAGRWSHGVAVVGAGRVLALRRSLLRIGGQRAV